MGANGGKESRNCEQLQNLCRGDLIKFAKLNENKYYIYSGNKERLYPLNEKTKEFFSYPEKPGEVATVTFAEACRDSQCSKITVEQWITDIGADISIENFNKKVMQTLLPGDIVKVKSHYALYIGNKKVIHLVNLNSKYGELTKRRKEELKEFPNAQALVTTDKINKISQNVKIFKANRACLHGYEAREIIRRAESQIGPASYNMLFQNSKHFAAEMKYGEQVNELKRSFKIGTSPYEWMSQPGTKHESDSYHQYDQPN
ncbi:uncharacterized protein LOC129928243 [Biomphalaria glabrata]|uniref:Uncharacterized protein LOC129928243 n=1 Tax=Biomphalaria glabrata TaxID=6526 RepID=A0A9W3BE44_BIOGL|nr:uncharacterized protein LOC129928243 [Biomphalaria glabrata]